MKSKTKAKSTASPAWVKPFRERLMGSIAEMIRNTVRRECEAIAGATDEGIERIEASVGQVIALREHLAVHLGHNKRLVAEVERLQEQLVRERAFAVGYSLQLDKLRNAISSDPILRRMYPELLGAAGVKLVPHSIGTEAQRGQVIPTDRPG